MKQKIDKIKMIRYKEFQEYQKNYKKIIRYIAQNQTKSAFGRDQFWSIFCDEINKSGTPEAKVFDFITPTRLSQYLEDNTNYDRSHNRIVLIRKKR